MKYYFVSLQIAVAADDIAAAYDNIQDIMDESKVIEWRYCPVGEDDFDIPVYQDDLPFEEIEKLGVDIFHLKTLPGGDKQ